MKVLRGNHAERREIRVGITDNVHIQVLGGLMAGDRVVVGDSTSLPASEKNTVGPPPPRRG